MPRDARQTKISAFFTSNASTVSRPVTAPDAAIELQPTTSREPTNTKKPYERLQGGGDDASNRAFAKPEIHVVESSGELSTSNDNLPDTATETEATRDYSIAEPEYVSEAEITSSSQGHSSTSTWNTSTDSRYTIQRISATDLTPFKRLLNTLLPVNYPPSFFTSITQTDSAFARIAMWHHKPGLSGPIVGGIKCRLEHIPPLPGPDGKLVRESQLYIQAIGVLSPYRRFGVAGTLLNEVMTEAKNLRGSELEEMGRVRSVYAHVWQASPDSLEWYKKRGFEVDELIGEYYRRLKPDGAWLVRKQLV